MKKIFCLLSIGFLLCISCDNKRKNAPFYKENKTDIAYKISGEYSEIPIKANIASELTFAFRNMANGINPFFASNDMEKFIRQATMGTLVFRHPVSGKMVENIAESVAVSPDFLSVVFTLDKNRKFSDGETITISDIEADFVFLKNILKNTKIGADFLSFDNDIRIDSTTDTQITLSFSQADPFVLERLANFPVIKKSEIERITDFNAIADSLRFTSSGTYMISEMGTDTYKLRVNPYYQREDSLGNSYPYTDKIILKQFSNREDLIRQFISGEVDLFEGLDGEFELLSAVMQGMENRKRVVDVGYGNSRIVTAYNTFTEKSSDYMKNAGVCNFIAGVLENIADEIPQFAALAGIYDDAPFVKPPVPKQLFTDDNGKLGFNNGSMNLRIVLFAGNLTDKIEEALKFVLDSNSLHYTILRMHDTADFINKVFYEKEYDIAMFEYDLFPEAWKTNELFAQSQFAAAAQGDELSKKKTLDYKWQFSPVFAQKRYFFLDAKIKNFYFRPDYGFFCDPLTLKMIFKLVVEPE
ncbi:MAG: hypothetical protein J1G30_03515 [Spirochaetales bacterium]|nr:hypothetical protein [Spirochaetales bacterium]